MFVPPSYSEIEGAAYSFPPSGGPGLEAAEAFYEQGGVDTRRRLILHDVNLQLIMEGESDDVRAQVGMLAQQLLDRDDVTEIVFSVARR